MDSKISGVGKPKNIRTWLVCARCGAGSIIYHLRTNDYLCHRCGATFIADFTEKTTTIKQDEE